MTKQQMLHEMDKSGWSRETDEKSIYEEIKDDYDEMLDELSGESVWFPNPRDTDAEDEDSI